MTIYRATVLDTPETPFDGGRLRAEQDCGLPSRAASSSTAGRSPTCGPRNRTTRSST